MIFSVFCWAWARCGKRKPVVSPAAAAAPPVILTNFRLLIFFDMGISLRSRIIRPKPSAGAGRPRDMKRWAVLVVSAMLAGRGAGPPAEGRAPAPPPVLPRYNRRLR